MKKILMVPALLSCALALRFTAHADTLDDFVLTGGGVDITFTLPASPAGNTSTCPSGPISCLPGAETAFYVSTLVTTNGVSAEETLAFPTFRFGDGLEIGATRYLGYQQLFEPDAANPTFVPGTYDLSGPVFFTDYTLTITPETAAAPAPEPSTMGLLGTGVLGLIGLVRSRRAGLR